MWMRWCTGAFWNWELTYYAIENVEQAIEELVVYHPAV